MLTVPCAQGSRQRPPQPKIVVGVGSGEGNTVVGTFDCDLILAKLNGFFFSPNSHTTVAMDQLTFKPNLTPAFQRKFQVRIVPLASYATGGQQRVSLPPHTAGPRRAQPGPVPHSHRGAGVSAGCLQHGQRQESQGVRHHRKACHTCQPGPPSLLNQKRETH